MRFPKQQEEPYFDCWHQWFAWHPVEAETIVGRTAVWLEKVWRVRRCNWGDSWKEYHTINPGEVPGLDWGK